jgi:hypothetical protein
MRILIVDMAGTCCAHHVWIDLCDGKGLKLLAVVLWHLVERGRDLTEAVHGPQAIAAEAPRIQRARRA